MPTALITGHAQEARKAQIFEPRQSPEQDEVLLEEFVLAPGESREYELNSATAGYRLIPLGPNDHVPEDTTREGFEPDQEGPLTQAGRAEQDAGKQALQAYEGSEPPPGAKNHRSATTDAPRPRQSPSRPQQAQPRKPERPQQPQQAPKPNPREGADSGTKPQPQNQQAPKSETLRSAEKTEQSAEQTRKAAENQKETK